MRQPKEMFLVRGRDGLTDVLAKLRHGPLAIDTETTGLDWRFDRVGSINLAAGVTAIVAVKSALEPVIRYVSDQVKRDRTLIFHNAKFDMHMLRSTFGLHIPYPVHDTQIESHLLDQRGVGNAFHSNHHLKDLAVAFVDPYGKDAEKELLLSIKAYGGKTKGDWMVAPRLKFAKYSALDAWYTLQLHDQFYERIAGWSQPEGYPSLMSLYETERWLTLALRDMEARGVRVSQHYLEKWREGLRVQLERHKRRLRRMAGRDILWTSRPQLQRLLYASTKDGGMGLHTDRRTAKGAMSTDKTALSKIAHPIGQELLQFNKTQHAYGTDAASVIRSAGDEGVVHCNFRQNVDTGRTSCSDPNLQGEDKKSGIRHAFRPRKGLVLRMADYSQIEMRFAAHSADEPMMIHGFNRDPNFDVHYATAQQMFATKQPTDEQRGHSKTMNFAMLYGAGQGTTAKGLTDRMTRREAKRACAAMGYRVSLAEDPHWVLAALLRKRYRQTMPAMPKATKEREQMCKGMGFVMDFFGRHRYLDPNDSYKAFNSEIQGSGGDQAKRGLVNVYRESQLNRGDVALLLLVHDELVYESDGNPRTDRMVLELMAERRKFKVPIIADMKGSAVSWQAKDAVSL